MANFVVTHVDLWFEYADLLQDLADVCDRLRRRGDLNPQQKAQLKFRADRLRGDAITWATTAGTSLLDSLEEELLKLKKEIAKLEALESEIKDVQGFISGVAEVIGVVTNIFKAFL
jgi:hypothetical protein